MLKNILPSILDLDLYKITVHQIIFHRFSNLTAEYEFKCRNAEKVELFKYLPYEVMKKAVAEFETLKLSTELYTYLKNTDYIKPSYIDYLKNFKLDPELHIVLVQTAAGWELKAKGPWLSIILFETLVLSTVNELYSQAYLKAKGLTIEDVLKVGRERLTAKINQLKEYNASLPEGTPVPTIIEFGTRRRFSHDWQKEVITTLINEVPANIVGTSNVLFAHDLKLRPIGTFGHEYTMGLQGVYPPQHAQRQAFKIWLDEYEGKWGTALTDTYGDEKFKKDFTLELARGFDGVRHDSGDPFEFGEMMITLYNSMNINPMSKRIVFSDGLDIPTMIALHKRFVGRINVTFGIGTNLTNDLGIPVPQNVMKITMCNNQPVAKLSNNAAKNNCKDDSYLAYLKHAVTHY